MKRYYLSKIKQVHMPTLGDVWTHRLAELGTYDMVGGTGDEIAVHPDTGVPLHKAVLVLVGGIDHRQLVADPEIIPMPAVPLDMKVSSIHVPTKLVVKAAIRALGYSDAEVAAVWDNADGIRDVLQHYGRLNKPDFDCDNFDLDES